MITLPLENQLYMAGYYDFRNFDLISYELVSEWIELKDRILGSKLSYHFDTRKRKVYIHNRLQYGYAVLGVYCFPPIEALWNNPWIREYVVAKVRTIVGDVRNKYGDTALLGGGTIEGESWITRGEDKIRELKEELAEYTMNNEPPDFFIA